MMGIELYHNEDIKKKFIPEYFFIGNVQIILAIYGMKCLKLNNRVYVYIAPVTHKFI